MSLKFKRRSGSLASVVLIALSTASPLAAQSPPTRGLLGTSPSDANHTQAFDAMFQLFSAFNDDPLRDQITAGDPGANGGLYTGLQAGLRYARHRPHFSVDFSAGSAWREERDPDRVVPVNDSASISVAGRLGHSMLQVTQSASYSPYHMIGVFGNRSSSDPTAPPELTDEYTLFQRRTSSFETSTSFSQALGRRSTLMLAYDRQYTTADDGSVLNTELASVRFTRQLSSHISAHAGYGRRLGVFGLPSARTAIHSDDIDLGIDYNRLLSISRRTKFTFGTGSSLTTTDGQTHHYQLLGRAALTHDIGRSWSSSVTYDRSMQFAEGFVEPVLSDSIGAHLGGYWGRRVDAAFSATSSIGRVGFSGDANGFETHTAGGRVRFAMTRYLALSTEYIYHYSHFGERVMLPSGFAQRFGHQEARIGLTTGLPLLR